MAGGESKPDYEVKKPKDKKTKKAVASSIDSLNASLKGMSLEQQVSTLLQKHAQILEENTQLQKSIKVSDRQCISYQKEKEQIEADHAKMVLTKSRLESVCRELQRQNKTIKDESMGRLREEEERRKEASNKFNTTLTEINALMKENTDKNTQLRDENQEMSKWLKDFLKQYESREEEVQKIFKNKDLQIQLCDQKLEKVLLEKKGHLEEISEYQKKAAEMSLVEIQLREQLNGYTEKYEEFQGTLNKSNKLFDTFRKEMDDMVKKIKKLEKETKSWKDRWEGANKALLDMVNERTIMQQKIDMTTKQNEKLQSLCRALQAQIKEHRSSQCEPESDNKSNKEENCENSEVAEPIQAIASKNAFTDIMEDLIQQENKRWEINEEVPLDKDSQYKENKTDRETKDEPSPKPLIDEKKLEKIPESNLDLTSTSAMDEVD